MRWAAGRISHDDVCDPPEEVAALGVAREIEPFVLAQQPVRLDRQLIALLVLLADREEPDLGPVDVEDLLAEDRAHVRELEEVLGPRVGVGAGVEEHARALTRRQGDGDRRPHHPRQTAKVQEACGQHGAGVARGDRRVGAPVGDGANAGDEARVRLGAHRLGRLVRHLDHLGRLDERQAASVETGGAEERHVDSVRCGRERTEDHLVGRVVATESVDGDAGHGLRDVEAKRFDFTAPVGAAGRADAVRALR